MNELRFWQGAFGPHSILCRCERECNLEEYHQLPMKMYDHTRHTHVCPDCGYVFGEDTWWRQTFFALKSIKGNQIKQVYRGELYTRFLEARYQGGFSFETSIYSRDLETDIRIPAKSKTEALENHLAVKLFLKNYLFRIIPETKNSKPRLILTETPLIKIYTIGSGELQMKVLASSEERAVDKFFDQLERERRPVRLGSLIRISSEDEPDKWLPTYIALMRRAHRRSGGDDRL